MKKLVFFDIDGTLAHPGQVPSPATVSAIRQLRANGHKAFLSTGRTIDSIPPAVAEIGFDGGIFSSGAVIEYNGEIIGNHFMPNALEELPQYIHAAKILGTSILRIWAGRKKASDCTAEERVFFLDQCKKAAAIAQAHDVILCLECHRRSYTETKEGALELMEHVNSPYFRIYWQPNPDISEEENLSYIRTLRKHITHLVVVA